ncbi:ribonuclease H-like domain-containing protein [Hypoxylon rubiginosum]|uniref:Ribonuclease H-like domain-containing protein n=1 Tax=Hypoxylon rubiginosum TaxID=110542 RepID=A0ACB9YIN4_9PEZI|nr:ribonuclease H-like domain-containing protein [Hypoxylon rubiginosum]
MAATSFIDTKEALIVVLDTLEVLPANPPSLYIDLEGVNLSRHGSISIFQLYVLPTKQTYLIDVRTLGSEAFTTPGSDGRTLKDILESETTPKVIFDVRNDSDALFSHFQIGLQGIQDLQLMELGTSTARRHYLKGLSRCIEGDLGLDENEVAEWKRIKESGIRLFAPGRGGSYEVFNVRPLSEEIRLYCSQDVQFLPRLWACYDDKLVLQLRDSVESATRDRVVLSQTADYDGNGKHMALAPDIWSGCDLDTKAVGGDSW